MLIGVKPLTKTHSASLNRLTIERPDSEGRDLDRPKVPPTNNLAERSLRPVVIMRRVIQGTRSDQGLEDHSVLRSLLETARRQGKKAHRFLLDLFTKDTAHAQVALYRNPPDKPKPPKQSRLDKPP